MSSITFLPDPLALKLDLDLDLADGTNAHLMQKALVEQGGHRAMSLEGTLRAVVQ